MPKVTPRIEQRIADIGPAMRFVTDGPRRVQI